MSPGEYAHPPGLLYFLALLWARGLYPPPVSPDPSPGSRAWRIEGPGLYGEIKAERQGFSAALGAVVCERISAYPLQLAVWRISEAEARERIDRLPEYLDFLGTEEGRAADRRGEDWFVGEGSIWAHAPGLDLLSGVLKGMRLAVREVRPRPQPGDRVFQVTGRGIYGRIDTDARHLYAAFDREKAWDKMGACPVRIVSREASMAEVYAAIRALPARLEPLCSEPRS